MKQLSLALLAASMPGNTDLTLENISTPQIEVPIERKLLMVERLVGTENATLRAAVVPTSGNYTIDVLAGDRIGKSCLRKLVHKDNYSFVINGTFFEGDYTLGDIVGVHSADPKRAIEQCFFAKQAWMSQRIAQRFAFAIDKSGNASIVRRSSIKHPKTAASLKSSQLSEHYSSFIGGLTAIDLRNPNVLRSILQSDDARFIHDFNLVNGRLNHTSAYDGLEGRASLARSAIGIIAHDGEQRIVLISVGQGVQRSKGLSIVALSHEFVKLARELKSQPLQLAFLDGASSTFSATPEKLLAAGGQPTTALAVKVSETFAEESFSAKR